MQCLNNACIKLILFIILLNSRFSDNMDLWNDYISFLKDKKATSTLNTVFGRALCLHPKNESLWLQAAVFEINENR